MTVPSTITVVTNESAATLVPEGGKLIHVDPLRALDGIDAIVRDPRSAASIAVYQQNFQASHIAELANAIHRHLTLPSFTRLPAPLDQDVPKYNRAHAVLIGSLSECERRIAQMDRNNDLANRAIQSLRESAQKVREEAIVRVLGSDTNWITKSLKESEKSMRLTFNSLVWWKLPVKVDDLGDDVTMALRTVWCRELERHLIYETGTLTTHQNSLRTFTLDMLDSLSPSFQSAVLRNAIAQLSTPTSNLTPSTLIEPLTTRVKQLITYSTAALHLRGQKLVLYTSLLSFFSGSTGYALWFTQWISPEYSFGVGILGVAISLRWAVGRWEKAKRAWWKDWARVCQGLERDLKHTLEDTLEQKILATPQTAAKSLETRAAERAQEVKQLREELIQLKQSINEQL